jgi:excisionase family DNA binding protein
MARHGVNDESDEANAARAEQTAATQVLVGATAPAIITPEELAALLRLDRKTVYSAIARGEIPGVRRFGRTLRISRDAVLAWLREGRVSRSRRKHER